MPITRQHRDARVRAEQRRFRRERDGVVWRAPELPRYYYLDHFERFLGEVREARTELLGADELALLDGFAALPFHARCAYVRLANRRGYVFDLERLDYPEIEALPNAWGTLGDMGFTEPVPPTLHPDWLERLTRPDLLALLEQSVDASRFRKSWKKAELVRTVLDEVDPGALVVPTRYVAQARREPLNYLLYLYFGRIDDNLQAFTLHDLGLIERPDPGEEPLRRFDSPEEAKAAFFYARALHDLRHGTPAIAARLVQTRAAWPDPPCGQCEVERDRLLEKLGGLAEKSGDIDGALALYAASDAPACNERTVRVRHRRNEGDDRLQVRARLEAMIDDPASDEELVFAEDFYARKFGGKRTSAATDLVRAAATLTVDEAWRQQPERGALERFSARGIEAYRAENALWRTLFLLVFHDELRSDEDDSGWRTPEALRTGTFLAEHGEAIEAKLAALDDPESALRAVLDVVARYANESAPDEDDRNESDADAADWTEDEWDEEEPVPRRTPRGLDAVRALLTHAPPGAVASVLRRMAGEWRGTRDGFPDLMLVEADRLRFVEIKTAGDALRRNQLARMAQLRAAGFDVELVKVRYGVDPEQTYAVVDVETTGNRPGLHRITELAAVRVRGGRIVDEFQTLVNPKRPVPAHIARLTGITDEMVADAPEFAEVADRFEAFVGDAVFVAHNVNFDYGFVAAEFEMIDRRFRRPKLCTCASMRRHCPGHESYSLKRLCADLGIELETHHRALCDARAAAALLARVNERRETLGGSKGSADASVKTDPADPPLTSRSSISRTHPSHRNRT